MAISSKTFPAVNPTPKKPKTPDDYEIRDAHDTLMKAAKIQQDPIMMKHVAKHHKKQKKAIRSVDDLIQRKHELANGSQNPMAPNDNDEDDA